jgi:hypothetical protein
MSIADSHTISQLISNWVAEKHIDIRIIWSSAQWDSVDGSDQELQELVARHGYPGQINFYDNG